MREFSLLNGRIQGIRFGQGRPVLAFHGFLDNAMSFKPLGDALKGVEIWSVDLPGHGRSSALPSGEGWTLMQWLPTLGRLMDELDWPRFQLLGHSLGGILAQMLAAVDDRIQTVIALDALGPIADTDKGNLDRMERFYGSRNADNNVRRYYSTSDQLWQARLKGRFPLSERSARLLSWRGVGVNDQGWFHRYDRRLREESTWRLTESQIRALLGRIACPLHLAVFESSPTSQLPDLIQGREACVPNLHRKTFPGSHHEHMENPEPIARWMEPILMDFES